MSAVKRINITVDPEVYEKFLQVAERKGIKVSTWVNQQMKEFVEKEGKEEKGT